MARLVRTALVFSIFGNYGALLITFCTTVAVSRLLTPAEVGAFVVASAFIILVDTVRDLNVGSYVVRAPNLDLPLMRSVFGVSLSLSVIAAGVMFSLAGPFAQMLGSLAVKPMLQVMAATYLISPLTVPALAVLQRELRYRDLVAFRLVSAAVRAAVSVGLIFAGWGAMSLAIGYVAAKVMELLLLIPLKTNYKFVRPSFELWRPIMRFSSVTATTNIVGTLGIKMADLFIGRFLGMELAGLYSRGGTLTHLYVSGIYAAVGPVAFSAFSAETRKEDGDVKRAYMSGTTLMTGFSWPFLSVLAILAYPLTMLLLGDQWAGAAPVSRLLSIGVAIFVTAAMSSQLLTAIGKAEQLLKRTIILQLPRLALYPLAAQFGIEEVALAAIIVQVSTVMLSQRLLREEIGMTYGDLWAATRSSLGVTLIVSMAAAAVYWLSLKAGAPLAAQLLAGAGTAAAAWLAAIFLLRHPAKDELLVATGAMRRRLNAK